MVLDELRLSGAYPINGMLEQLHEEQLLAKSAQDQDGPNAFPRATSTYDRHQPINEQPVSIR